MKILKYQVIAITLGLAMGALSGKVMASDSSESARAGLQGAGNGSGIRSSSSQRTATTREVTIYQALNSTRHRNVTWKSLGELLVQAKAATRINLGILLPKIQAEGQWLRIGETYTIDLSSLATTGEILGTLTDVVLEEHPEHYTDFLPYLDTGEGESEEDPFAAFSPVQDTVSATFSLSVPVLNPSAISGLQASFDQRDATIQRVGYGRRSLLYSVAQLYYGLLTIQSMQEVAVRSLEAAQEHFKSNQVKAKLQAATNLEVKRAELEVAKVESQLVELKANRAKNLALLRYLTGLKGDFSLVDPALNSVDTGRTLKQWIDLAKEQRQDLMATRIEVEAARHDVQKVGMKYLPTLNLFGQAKLDNVEEQRYDDDPFSWTVGATMTLNVFDGGIREGELQLARSQHRRARLAQEDLEESITNEVTAAFEALTNARAARRLAEHQLEVARATQDLAKVSQKAGAATTLELIDVNTMVFSSEVQALSARFSEATAQLELLSACGKQLPWLEKK